MLELIPLSVLYEYMTESVGISPELAREQLASRAKELVRTVLSAGDELAAMPRDVLIEVAWKAIAHYHREGAAFGFDNPDVMAFKREKESRLSLLTYEEREVAVTLANGWLDEHFAQ